MTLKPTLRKSVQGTSQLAKSTLGGILSLPTSKEIQACWELCRLHNNIGFWVVWLPTGDYLQSLDGLTMSFTFLAFFPFR